MCQRTVGVSAEKRAQVVPWMTCTAAGQNGKNIR